MWQQTVSVHIFILMAQANNLNIYMSTFRLWWWRTITMNKLAHMTILTAKSPIHRRRYWTWHTQLCMTDGKIYFALNESDLHIQHCIEENNTVCVYMMKTSIWQKSRANNYEGYKQAYDFILYNSPIWDSIHPFLNYFGWRCEGKMLYATLSVP
jgi:hypothetical protein